ncbi:hypothetical protein CHU94_18425 [Rhodoferax sp. TH121]|uniref:oligosaccharide flippase family protein n=1 Tax=Rhodoferax sp. TH121 TaxID=2022803 RepID=UPI000B9795DC|nr:oligosaccharide flippase family protein [Rhodoferax sp. TH121]OYQ39349.1 hypothetical protein CHU94_18425 [Rhodoferax sp. TH121]
MSSIKSTLRNRVYSAAGWTILSYALSQVARLGTNLILSRILFPEAFGLMAIIFTIQAGVNLLTDMGISAGIITHKNGDNPNYINTAWTFQIIRGLFMAIAMYLIAPIAAKVMNAPELKNLMQIVSLSPLIAGFTSTKIAIADRKILAGRRVAVEILTIASNSAITIAFAYLLKTTSALVWALVAGNMLSVAMSHWLIPGEKNRIHWQWSSAKGILSLGGLTLISSSMTYFTGEGARLFSATMLDLKTLGLVTLAGALSWAPWQAIQTVSNRVFMPMYAELYRTGDSQRMQKTVLQTRYLQLTIAWLLYFFIILFASKIISLLFDSRYQESIGILRIQCIGMMIGMLYLSYNGLFLAINKLNISIRLQAIQGLFLWGGMYIGFHLAEADGLLWGIAVSNLLIYPAYAIAYKSIGFLNLKTDLFFMTATGFVALLIFKWTN